MTRIIYRVQSNTYMPLWPSQQVSPSKKPVPPPTIPIPPGVFPPGGSKWILNPNVPIVPPQPPVSYPPGTVCKGGTGRFPNCEYCPNCYYTTRSGSGSSDNNLKTIRSASDPSPDNRVTGVSYRKPSIHIINIQNDKRVSIFSTDPKPPSCPIVETTTTTPPIYYFT